MGWVSNLTRITWKASRMTMTQQGNFQDLTDNLGGRLRAARNAVGLSQASLAEQLGVGRKTIIAWEENSREPRANRLTTLAGILGVSLVWLMSGQSNGTTNVEHGQDKSALVNATINEMRNTRAALQVMIERLNQMELQLSRLQG